MSPWSAQSSAQSSIWRKRLGGAAWAVLTLLHVLEHGAAEADGRVRPEPLAVAWGHCTVVARESELVCIYDPEDAVRLWIDHHQASEARVRIDGVEVSAQRYSLAAEPHGQGLRVTVPPDAFELEVEVPEGSGVRAWGLPLRERARQEAAPGTGLDAAVLEELGLALGSDDVARIARATGGVVDGLLVDGRLADAVSLLCRASFVLRRLRSFEAAAGMLARAQELGSSFPAGRNTTAVYRGLLLWSQGDLHEAAPLLRDGARYALRVEDLGLAGDSIPIYAEALAELGYYEEARYWAHEGLEQLVPSPCDRASVLRTTGWINLVLRERGQPHDDPRTHLREAIDLYRTQAACAHKEAGARLSLALLAFQDGDVVVASEQLGAIDAHALSAEDRVRATDLRVRLQLETGADAAAAWRAWSELRAAASVVDDDDARWRVEVRRGEIHVGEHDGPAALAAFERAEQRLDRLVRAQAVVGVGRTAMADRYLDGTRALVSLLVDQRQLPQALCVAREARARRRSAAAGIDVLPPAQREEVREKLRRYREHKRQADQSEALVAERPQAHASALLHDAAHASQAAAELVDEIVESLVRASASPRCHELVRPAPGELLVGLYPRADDWLVFTQDERGTEVRQIAAPTDAELAGDPQGLAMRLLEPISGALAAASRVRVLADRQAQEVDVHLLPWRGQPLLAQVPVTYGVELPALPDPVIADPPRALLLADPTGTLMSARVETQAVADQLRHAHWTVDMPATDDADTPVEVSLAGYALLHYAAHTATRERARRVWAPYPAGEAGGLPHLQTGPTARLEVHDILALRPVPPLAFLAGCKTGLVELDAGSTSVALAFLLADGRQVVASRENVDDAVGLEIARRFYERFVAGGDAAVAMHEVQQALQREGEAVVPYRVWVR